MTADADSIKIPGAPGPEPAPLDEPTQPRGPLPPKPDQSGPDTYTPTGAPTTTPQDAVAQQGERLTTAQGAPLRDTDHSLKAGRRGPVLLQDHHLREKITHFDHERIPERVVHARGAAAHGVFVANGEAERYTSAAFLKAGTTTETFVRFSTVLGSRGSADTVRDTRGFATKFYTSEGVYDLVGNNIPVFFIQDAIKFPDIIHAGKPHPDREIPQAQSAHDTFWDFVSLHTEAQHHTIWNMSDRGIPRSYRMMQGFGIHTFRLVKTEADGSLATTLVKFHWRPRLGTHAVTWEEAQLISGKDPDFHRRDLADAIEAGAYPEWDFGIQVFPDTEDQTFHGIDLLDPTKIVPEELAPIVVVGTMTLNRNPSNYFAETEQVAFHPGHLVPGIDVTSDPLLQGRLFSYLDTQISRLGGPNFGQLPINRPHAEINDMLRDGMHQTVVHRGVAPYHPNSLDGGCPFPAMVTGGEAFTDVPQPIQQDVVTREQPASFDDHFSQARLFYRSLTPVEQLHVKQAYAFELGKVYEQAIKERQLQCLANIDAELCAFVANELGLPAPAPTEVVPDVEISPALRMVTDVAWPADGRQVGIVVDDDTDASAVASVRETLHAAGVTPLVIAPHGGKVGGLDVQRSFHTATSVELDAVIVLAPAVDPRVLELLREAFRHDKAIGVSSDAEPLLPDVGVPATAPGVVTGDAAAVAAGVLDLLPAHRVWAREGV
ncbi:catalase CatB [Gryllotalpicola daejeonensis]|uniref:Catalase n=1 Tax=Gryllotalpicola daejeonensis TaxID=993087 RepID=A0ABP7ZGS0_9MICO